MVLAACHRPIGTSRSRTTATVPSGRTIREPAPTAWTPSYRPSRVAPSTTAPPSRSSTKTSSSDAQGTVSSSVTSRTCACALPPQGHHVEGSHLAADEPAVRRRIAAEGERLEPPHPVLGALDDEHHAVTVHDREVPVQALEGGERTVSPDVGEAHPPARLGPVLDRRTREERPRRAQPVAPRGTHDVTRPDELEARVGHGTASCHALDRAARAEPRPAAYLTGVVRAGHMRKGPFHANVERALLSCAARAASDHLRILVTRPAPTVRPPSRMANFRPSSMAIGWMSSTFMSVLSPGMTISVPSGSFTTPVTSVVRK